MSHRVLTALILAASVASAADWPNWLGPDRTGKAGDFTVPATWPKELKKGWSTKVGDGVATPALVGDKLFVFSREGGDEVIRCLNADTGKEVWADKYPAKAVGGPASGFPGPRASPAVADGMVVTLGVQGTLSCVDAAGGKKVWRKDDTGTVPRFSTSSSPLVTDGKVVMQYGDESKGGMIAFDLKTGDEKWKWPGDGTAYASPILMTVDKTKLVVAATGKSIVALTLDDGKKVWDAPYAVVGRGYNAATPMPDGATLVYTGSGRGTKAVKLEQKDGKFTASEVWANKEQSAMYCTPVVKDGLVYGQTADDTLYCLDEKTGNTVWTKKAKSVGGRTVGYGSIVDAGKVLLSLTPAGELLVFEPGGKECKEVAKYTVASGNTFAFPVVTDKRVFIKDGNSVTLWTVE